MVVKSIEGATLFTATGAQLVSVRFPSLTSRHAEPDQSSPHTCDAVELGDHAVSHVPSASKSHRNVSASPSGSDEVPPLNVTGVPSYPTYGPPESAVGFVFTRTCVVSFASSCTAHSEREEARTVATSSVFPVPAGTSTRATIPYDWFGLRIGGRWTRGSPGSTAPSPSVSS